MTSPLYNTATNPNGSKLVGGIARMWFEQGFPIDMSYEILKEKGDHVDWLEALADAWLNDPLKYDIVLRDIAMLEGSDAAHRCNECFKQIGATILAQHPSLKSYDNPVDEACRIILEQKRSQAIPV